MTSLRLLLDRFAMWCSRVFGRNKIPHVSIIRTRSIRSIKLIPPQTVPGAVLVKRSNRKMVESPKHSVSLGKSQRIVVKPVTRAATVPVVRQPTSYWGDKGWTRSRQTYSGYFGLDGYKCRGRVEWSRDGLRSCHIYNPPQQLWKHTHRHCFSHIGNGTYAVHFQKRPQTVDAAIITIEKSGFSTKINHVINTKIRRHR